MQQNFNNNHETLTKNLHEAYYLISQTIDTQFPIPQLYYGDVHVDKHLEYTSRNDSTRHNPILMLYDSETNSICARNRLLEESNEERILSLTHEMGHAFIHHCCSEIDNLEIQKEDETKLIYLTVNEGIADHIAIISCYHSKHEKLIEVANKCANKLDQLLLGYIRKQFNEDATFYFKAFGLDTIDENGNPKWKETAWHYFTRNGGIILAAEFKYIMGRHFIKNAIEEFSLNQILTFPPTTYKQLIFPEIYKEYVKLRSGAAGI